MFDLIEVTDKVEYSNQSVHYNVTFELSSISGRIQNIQYFYNGEECELSDLWDGMDIKQFKNMVADYKNYSHTITEC